MNGKIQQISDSANLAYIESLYAAYIEDPSSLDEEWRGYFAAFNGDASATETTRLPPSTIEDNGVAASAKFAAGNLKPGVSTLQEQVNEMIRAFRSLGHKAASIDP